MPLDQNTLNTLVSASIGREQEVFHYQINIDNYTSMLAALPDGDWPADIAQWQGADVSTLPHNLPDATVQAVSDYQYRDRLRALLRTERIEQGKARRVLDAMRAQIGADYEEILLNSAAIDLETAKTIALRKIDADVDALYGAVIGNRGSEYAQAEAEALAYKAAGYTGDVPPMVQSWATVKGWTGQAAADDILATAAQWRGAQVTIREKRLGAKELIRTALTALQVDAHLDAWGVFIAYMRKALET